MEQTAFLIVFLGLFFYFGWFYKISHISDSAEQNVWKLGSFFFHVCAFCIGREKVLPYFTVICEI